MATVVSSVFMGSDEQTNEQTNKQTDRQTDGAKNNTSSAVTVAR